MTRGMVLAAMPSGNFHGEKRSNETHESTTDSEAKLYRKGHGQPAKLCYMGHALMENRNGLVIGGQVTQANGTAQRAAALSLIDRHRRRNCRRWTFAPDQAYYLAEVVSDLRT